MPNYTPPDFQEQHSMSNPSDQGTLRNLNLQTAGIGDTKSVAEIFEKTIEEIDKELNTFDPKAKLASNKIANTGLVLASLSRQIPLPATILEVETLAARRALEFVADIGVNRVILEGDSSILIKALQGRNHSLAQFGHIAKDVKYIASCLQHSRVVLALSLQESVSRLRGKCNSFSLLSILNVLANLLGAWKIRLLRLRE
nr:hypothetical protein CFP56_36003 [Quercus suber]